MLAFKTAIRFIKKSYFQSIIIVLTVIIGIGVQFFVLALGTILNNMILEQTTQYQDHIIIYNNEKNSQDDIDYEFRNKILEHNSNIKYALYKLQLLGKITTSNNVEIPFDIFVVDNEQKNDNYKNFYGIGLEKHLVRGRINDTNKNEIMLDDYFAHKNNLNIGDKIIFNHIFQNENYEFIIVGTYDLGRYIGSRNYTYLNIEHFNIKQKVSYNLYLQLNNPMKVKKVEKDLLSIVDERYKLANWRTLQPELEVLNLAQQTVIGVIEILISLAVFVVIVSVLSYSIKQKYKQIGILKAMGFNNSNVNKIFIYQTLFLAIIGSVIGLIAGTITMFLYSEYMKYPNGNHRFNYTIEFSNYIISFSLTIITVIIASYLSIKRTHKLSIIDLIKI